MMTVGRLYDLLDSRFPIDLRAEWDNDGLMFCLDKGKEVGRVLISLDVTLECIEYAAENGFDVIVSHHPLIFKPISCLDFSGVCGKRLKKLIENHITVMSFHTRLDCVGVNHSLCQALGLINVDTFMLDGLPMGRIGELRKEMTGADFACLVKNSLGAHSVNYPVINGKSIKKVALIGGAGGDAIGTAIKLGADALLTGECSYNKVIDAADIGFYVVTAGHFFTENTVCTYLKGIVDEMVPGAVCSIYNSNITVNI